MLLDRQLGLVVEDSVEDVGRVADGGADDAGGVVGVLVGGPDVEGDAAAAAEVARDPLRVGRLDADRVALAVGAGEAPGAPGLGERQRVVGVDDPRVGGGERFGAQVPLRRPRELLRVDPRGLAHARVAEVAGVREQRGVAVLAQPGLTRRRAVRVRELLAEAGPGVDVDQDVGEIDGGQARSDVARERRHGLGPLESG